MIGFLSGEILQSQVTQMGKLLVGLGNDGNRVGYTVLVPRSVSYSRLKTGDPIELYIHTHVREDALDLFGFQTQNEKDLYLILLSVNGIGPKVALGMLSHAEPQQIANVILEKDKAFLNKIPGIGKKTAERIILELSEPIRKHFKFDTKPSQLGLGATSAKMENQSIAYEAREALVGLGYKDAVAGKLIDDVYARDSVPKSVEELVKEALRSEARSGANR